MNEIENAILVLSIVIIIILIISYLYENQKMNPNSIEPYANYQDVKTKTKNWCKKMLNVGLLKQDQYESCISTFQDPSSGVMPKEFKTPSTGMSRNYSLYNTNSKELTPNLSGENTNNIMLVNNEGFYLACDKNNNAYFIKDINSPGVSQTEIYFTLIPQSNNNYSLMSSYGKYLFITSGPNVGDASIPTGMSSRQDWCATFSAKKIGTMTNWLVTILQNDTNSNGNKATFQSVQLTNFFLSSTQNSQDRSLVINYGSDETNTWLMIPKSKTDSKTDSKVSIGSTQYIVTRDLLFNKKAEVKANIISAKSTIDSLKTLQSVIRNNYDNIKKHIESLLTSSESFNNQDVNPDVNPDVNTDVNPDTIIESFESKKLKPQTQEQRDWMIKTFGAENAAEIQKAADLVLSQKAQYEKQLQEQSVAQNQEAKAKQANAQAYSDIKNKVVSNIMIMKNDYLQKIEADITTINTRLVDFQKQEKDIDNDYATFLTSINSKLLETQSAIDQNNIIMDRQRHNFDKLNSVYTTIEKKSEDVEKLDKISSINTDIISKTNESNYTLTIIYPLIIFILIICLLYLIYLTYKKFMESIYLDYS
jgi:hypothetical protein